MDTEKIIELMPKIAQIVKAALSAKNRTKITELVSNVGEMKEDVEGLMKELFDDAGVCAQLVLEILQDPLSEAGIDLQIKSRDINKAELETLIKAGLARHL